MEPELSAEPELVGLEVGGLELGPRCEATIASINSQSAKSNSSSIAIFGVAVLLLELLLLVVGGVLFEGDAPLFMCVLAFCAGVLNLFAGLVLFVL